MTTIADRLAAAYDQAARDMNAEADTSDEGAGYLAGLTDAMRLAREHTPAFAREVTIRPAFDCLEVQPCVKGSTACGTEPGANHGRGTARMHLALYTPRSEVRLAVDTGWHHPATPDHIRGTYAGMNLTGHTAELGYHSAGPMPGAVGPVEAGEHCPRGWPVCYSTTEFGRAAEAVRLLIVEGTDAVWAWLEDRHRDTFGPQTTGGAR